jgi:hypothetical protein
VAVIACARRLLRLLNAMIHPNLVWSEVAAVQAATP